jgi:hypothetical protein
MRYLHILAGNVWYGIRTSVNNDEPLFQSKSEKQQFEQILAEASELFAFEMRGREASSWDGEGRNTEVERETQPLPAGSRA